MIHVKNSVSVLEEDYERKRWERKVAKMRGRPRKRRRREVRFEKFW